MTPEGDLDATEARSADGAPSSPGMAVKSDTFLQDIRDSWDERHAKRADVSYRVEEAKAAMRTSGWGPGTDIAETTRREADRYLSARYRLAEALAERDAGAVSAVNASSAATGFVGGVWATVVSGVGTAIAAVVSGPRRMTMWRLTRFSVRHPELRELDATVNSRPDTRREVIDGRAADHVTAAGYPDPVHFSQTMTWLFRLDEPPLPTLSPKDAANRASVGRVVRNAMHAAREAYLNDSAELYLAPEELRAFEGAGHNSTTSDPSLGGKG